MISQQQKLQLRRKAHQLHPVILLGQHGLTPEVQKAIDEALTTHELIKVRVNADDKAQREAFISEILSHQGAELIQQVGHIIVIYRKRPKDNE